VRSELHFDAVVIGAGTAGLTAATRLAQEGARVCVLAKGVGSTHLAPATIDVLGYAPELVPAAGAALEPFVAQRPDHPYALLGAEVIGDALAWFQATVERGPYPGYHYVGGLHRNGRHPSALGALRPSALVASTMAAGEASELRRVCIVGTQALRDFHPSLCAANLTAAGIEARPVSLELRLERADMSALGIARHFDDPSWRARFCAELSLALRAEEHVGLPAMLGIEDPQAVLGDLEQRLGRRVFEIPTLPPSVPGIRLYEILRSALRGAGGRLVLGAEVVDARRDHDGGRVTAVTTRAAGRDLTYLAPTFVLAAGGFASGAIELDSHWVTHERVLGLPLRGLPGEGGPRFVGTYLEEQPLARVGVAVDGELRAHGTENVFVAGAALAGATPWREHSGEGIALASGFRAAQVIGAGQGARAGVTV
jgi:glycerol-3-phosphate dehydrogenase subunit B